MNAEAEAHDDESKQTYTSSASTTAHSDAATNTVLGETQRTPR